MSASVVPVSGGGDTSSAMGSIRAAAFAKKLKKKTEVVSHDLRNMFIAFVPLFILIGLAAFILQLIEYENEKTSAEDFVAASNELSNQITDLQSRTEETLDVGNMDRIHAPQEQITVGNSSSSSSNDWNMTTRALHCYKNGTIEELGDKVVRALFLVSFSVVSIYVFVSMYVSFIHQFFYKLIKKYFPPFLSCCLVFFVFFLRSYNNGGLKNSFK
jgi:hypothetical protein